MLLKITGGGVVLPDESWASEEVWIDSTSGPTTIPLSAVAGLPPMSFWLRKADPTSNTIHLKPQEASTKLNHFWRGGQDYGLFLNLTQNMGRVSYDGANDFALGAAPFNRGTPQSQRTVTIPSWTLTPESVWEVVNVNTEQAGADVFIGLSDIHKFLPPSLETGGNYNGFIADICKVDAGPHIVAIGPEKITNDWRIEPSNDLPGYDRGYFYLKAKGDYVSLYIHAAGFRVRSMFRAGMVP